MRNAVPSKPPPSEATGQAEAPDRPRGTQLWLIGLTLLTAGLWVAWGMHFFPPGNWPASPAEETPATVVPEPATAPGTANLLAGTGNLAIGPWGELEIIPITISRPLELLGAALPKEQKELVWYFPNTDRSRLAGQLLKADLPDSLRSELMSRAEVDDLKVGGYVIRPGRDLVLGLSPEIRARLYAILHDCGQNLGQRDAFRYCGTSIEEWFRGSAMSPETASLVTPLIYRNGRFLFFADAALVAPMLASPQERTAMLRTLVRESTMLLRLRLSHDSDIESLVSYWGRGGRAKDVRPILESFSHFEGRQDFDVTHLLPPFARQRIYTYPTPPARPSSIRRDCHWTALNFFSEQPDDRFGDPRVTSSTMDKDYYCISGDPRFGDLVVFVNHEGSTIHSAVYIAANIVFTKNGTSTTRPWVFHTLDSMKDYYPRSKGLTMGWLRRRGT